MLRVAPLLQLSLPTGRPAPGSRAPTTVPSARRPPRTSEALRPGLIPALGVSPECLPLWAWDIPAEQTQNRWPGLRLLCLFTGRRWATSWLGGNTGEKAWEPSLSPEPLRRSTARPRSRVTLVSPQPWLVGSEVLRSDGRTALTLVTLPVGWHGSPG